MARKALKSALKKIRRGVKAPFRAAGRKIQESRQRVRDRSTARYQDDKQTLESMRKSGVEMGSPLDPNSRARRKVNVQAYERKNK